MTRKRVTAEATILGQNLKKIRCGAGLSLQDIGKILEVSQQQVRKYECGHNRFPIEKLFRLRAYYDVPYDLFFEGFAPPGKEKDAGWDLFLRFSALRDRKLKYKTHAILSILLEGVD
jgi:transcriptional regulator with XRE-family HTH domain